MLFGKLTITYSDKRQRVFPLTKATIRIGRTSDNDVILDDERISRHHADILCSEDGLEVLDLGSTNGVHLDGFRIPANQPVPLPDASILELGRIRIEVGVAQADAALVPAAVVDSTPDPAVESHTKTRTPAQAAADPEGDLPVASAPVEALAEAVAAESPDRATAEQAPGEPAAPPAEAAPALGPSIRPAWTESQPELFELQINKTDFAVKPGTPFICSVIVTNKSEQVSTVALGIELYDETGSRAPADELRWYSITPVRHVLYPEAQGGTSSDSFIVTFHPKRVPSSTAGNYTCRFSIHSLEFGLQPARETIVEFLAYIDFEPELDPQTVRGRFRGKYRIVIQNRSNTALPLRISATDAEKALSFDFDPPAIKIASGEQHVVHATVHSDRRWPFGRSIAFAFKNIFTPTVDPEIDGAASQQRDGGLKLALLSPWLLLIPVLLLLPLLLLIPPRMAHDLYDPRQTARLQFGPVGQRMQVDGQIMPVEVIALAFRRDGVISDTLKVGARVSSGDSVAELRPLEQLRAIRAAEDAYARAQRELENVRSQQNRDIQMAKIDLEQAQENVALVMPNGPEDPARQLQQNAVEAQRAGTTAMADASKAKLDATENLMRITAALQEAQQNYSKAFWNNDWVERNGTDPNASGSTSVEVEQALIPNPDPKKPPIPRPAAIRTTSPGTTKLNTVQKQAFKDALATAERQLHEAERAVDTSQRALDRARADEITVNQRAQETAQENQRKLDNAISGADNPALSAANRANKVSQIKLDTAMSATIEPQLKAVDDARRQLEIERAKLAEGRIIAPLSGIIIKVSAQPGDAVKEQATIIQLAAAAVEAPTQASSADPPPDAAVLETTANLTEQQLADLKLKQGDPVTVTLLTENPIDLPGKVRRFVAAPASDQSSVAPTPNQTVRFSIDTRQPLSPDTATRLTFANAPHMAYWLPPPYVRKDGDNRYILIRQGLRDRRVDVVVGAEMPDMIEIKDTFESPVGGKRFLDALFEEQKRDQEQGQNPDPKLIIGP